MTWHVYFKCCFRLFVIIEQNLVLFSRFVVKLFVIAAARTILKMSYFGPKIEARCSYKIVLLTKKRVLKECERSLSLPNTSSNRWQGVITTIVSVMNVLWSLLKDCVDCVYQTPVDLYSLLNCMFQLTRCLCIDEPATWLHVKGTFKYQMTLFWVLQPPLSHT